MREKELIALGLNESLLFTVLHNLNNACEQYVNAIIHPFFYRAAPAFIYDHNILSSLHVRAPIILNC